MLNREGGIVLPDYLVECYIFCHFADESLIENHVMNGGVLCQWSCQGPFYKPYVVLFPRLHTG